MEHHIPEIAVIAGTPYDAQLGAELLKARGLPARPWPMAAGPDEQDAMQYLGADALNRAFRDQLSGLAARGTTLAMLFCNSLSSVLDLDAADRMSPVTVISPVTVYRGLSSDLKKILVLTGNGQAIVGFERTLMLSPAGHSVLGVSDPALVRAIEVGDPDGVAYSHLPAALRLAEDLGFDAVVLACTHFTEILPFAEALSTVPVIDVGTALAALVCEAAGLPAAFPG